MALPPLATAADLTDFGYEDVPVALLLRASTRVRRYTRQEITPGTTTVTLHGVGPWLLPQRPVTEVTTVVDAEENQVEHELRGQHLHTRRCGPLTVTWSHGFSPLPDELVELVCSIASRMASTPAGMHAGARTEQAGGESVTWGSDAYGGTTGLTETERAELDRLLPRLPSTVRLRP